MQRVFRDRAAKWHVIVKAVLLLLSSQFENSISNAGNIKTSLSNTVRTPSHKQIPS